MAEDEELIELRELQYGVAAGGADDGVRRSGVLESVRRHAEAEGEEQHHKEILRAEIPWVGPTRERSEIFAAQILT